MQWGYWTSTKNGFKHQQLAQCLQAEGSLRRAHSRCEGEGPRMALQKGDPERAPSSLVKARKSSQSIYQVDHFANQVYVSYWPPTMFDRGIDAFSHWNRMWGLSSNWCALWPTAAVFQGEIWARWDPTMKLDSGPPTGENVPGIYDLSIYPSIQLSI